MIFFILKIFGAWLVLGLISVPVLPLLKRRFAKHHAWVEQSRQPPLKMYHYPEVRETHRPQ